MLQRLQSPRSVLQKVLIAVCMSPLVQVSEVGLLFITSLSMVLYTRNLVISFYAQYLMTRPLMVFALTISIVWKVLLQVLPYKNAGESQQENCRRIIMPGHWKLNILHKCVITPSCLSHRKKSFWAGESCNRISCSLWSGQKLFHFLEDI